MARIRYCASPDVFVSPKPGTEAWTEKAGCTAEDLALDAAGKETNA
jgi:hypothetical protein